MNEIRQARWQEPTLFEMGGNHKRGFRMPLLEKGIISMVGNPISLVPIHCRRKDIHLPALSEVEVVRHFTRLSQMSFGIDSGAYPLGSCTMKYNPKLNEIPANSEKVKLLHPDQNEATIQGALELMYRLSHWLAEITGTHTVTLQPAAGAHGEFTGGLIMRAYHKQKGELDQRNEMIIPDSAHGTNPSSAAMAGFKVIIVPTGDDGCVNFTALQRAVSHRTAGLMLTNPNTLGLFEDKIMDISELIHNAGGLLYYDGANLNAILGKAKPGEMGFDIVHINLHKTFSTPHGGGGPGAGPVGVTEELAQFLPVPLIDYNGTQFYFDYHRPNTIGKVRCFHGNFGVLVRAFAYILFMGAEGLEQASEIAVLNANYLARKIATISGFNLPFGVGKPRKHECVISCTKLKADTGIGAREIAKRLMDYGVHPPTINFPLIVDEALMIEPTESESIEELNRLISLFTHISKEAYANPSTIVEAPRNTSVAVLDEVRASHPKTMCLSWRMYQKKIQQGFLR